MEKNWINGIDVYQNELVILENCRFHKGEKTNTPLLSKKISNLCDIYINDAFGVTHRSHSSNYGIACYAPQFCIGPLISSEITNLSHILKTAQKPLLAIVGGSKISTKLKILTNLSNIVDNLIIGGGIANTLLASKNHPVGKSIYEPLYMKEAHFLACKNNVTIPSDVITAKKYNQFSTTETKKLYNISFDDMILDLGPQSTQKIINIIQKSKTIIWNGPLGAHEFEQFRQTTKMISHAIANSKALSLVGGGDTIAAIEREKLSSHISYISTGGGAFLEFISGNTLPSISILKKRFQ